jgi:hypothetical protein
MRTRLAVMGALALAALAPAPVLGPGREERRRSAPSSKLPGKRLPDPHHGGRPYRRCPVTGLKLRA